VRPPRLAEWLLCRLLDAISRDVVAGDLAEEYVRVHRTRGAGAARRWYWRQASRSVVTCRLSGRRSADQRPIDFDTGGHMTLRDLLRPALRQFRDHPLYAFAVAGTLALAIAAACATLAVIKRAFLDPLPYANDAELVSILTESDGSRSAVSPHVLEELRRASPPFSGFGPIRPMSVTYHGDAGVEQLGANAVTPEYFRVIGVSPAMGRVFEDGEAGAIIVSWRFWERSLASDPGAVGRQLTIDNQPRTVVGVMPQSFTPPYWSRNDYWVPLDLAALLAEPRGRRTLSIIARRAPGVSDQQAHAFLAAFSADLQQRYPVEHGRMSWVAPALRDEMIGTAGPALLGTSVAAAVLLLIVGVNIAGLSTAHAAATRHQLAIRAALGATRARLLVGHVVDSVVIAALGTAAGVWLGHALVTVAARYQRQFLDRLPPIELDTSTVAITAMAGIAVGVIAALAPRGLMAANRPVIAALHARGATADLRLTRLRSTLVVVQVALALVLIVGAGLLVRTVSHLSALSLGFDSERLTTFNVTLAGAKYASPDAQIVFERSVTERLRAIHGVTGVTASVGFPVVGGMGAALTIQGRAQERGYDEIGYLSVAPNFFSTIGARLIAGRDLAPADDRGAPQVVVINETMARRFWPEGDAVGAQVQIGPGVRGQRWITVVGVIADLSDLGPTERVRPTAFGSTWQYSWPRRHFTVRSSDVAPLSLAMDLRSAVASVDPGIAVTALAPVNEMVSDRVARHRLVMFALTLFGGVAFALCAAGLYAVVALASRLRRREYAIRMALGAARQGVRWMVIRQALLVGGLGTAAGAIAAAGATRWIQGLLHGVAALDPLTFIVASGALMMLALGAAWQPARHAERIDPVETLRTE
jgi:predicted permease